MEKTNNGTQTKNNSIKKFIPFLISLFAGLLLVGGLICFIQNKQSESRSSLPAPVQKQTGPTPAAGSTSPASAPESASAQSIPNLTGKWAGKYKVSSPKGCAGFSGSWTASINQSGDSFSGSYKSDVLVNGVVSGKVSGAKGFSWTVSGGGASLTGSVTGSNAISGKFTGPTCPGTSSRTTGTFSGGR